MPELLPALELRDAGKRYRKVEERTLLSAARRRHRAAEHLWSLRDVSFSVGRGESLAVIGGNGAGKSTLLRLLASVTQPTEGLVITRGRVAPLLSVGVGFHQEMTGRENVMVNAMLLGLDRDQVRARFDAIVEFAELHEFMDTPVKFYSSGMFMRLGFSVAIHVEPDILLVDEILAVGDAGFQLRCLNRLRELAARGMTVVFVSHSMHAVQLLCPRAIVLDGGKVCFDGSSERAIALYHELTSRTTTSPHGQRIGFAERQLLDALDRPVETVEQGMDLTYQVTVRFADAVEGPGIRFRLVAGDGTLVYAMQSPVGERWRRYEAGEEATVRIRFHARLGGGGAFRLATDVVTADGDLLAQDEAGPTFFVPPLLGVLGVADLSAGIDVDGADRSRHRWSRLGSAPTEPTARQNETEYPA